VFTSRCSGVLVFRCSGVLVFTSRCSGVLVFTSRCSGVHVDFAEETLNFDFNTFSIHVDKVSLRGEEGIAQNLEITIPYGQFTMGKSSNVQNSLKSSSKFDSTFKADKCRH